MIKMRKGITYWDSFQAAREVARTIQGSRIGGPYTLTKDEAWGKYTATKYWYIVIVPDNSAIFGDRFL